MPSCKPLKRRILSLLFCLTACALSAQAQYDQYGRWENGVSEPWFMESTSYSSEEAATARARWAMIEADIKAGAGNAWAGGYFVGGDTHGSYLRWSEQSGFVIVHVDKCAARVMDLSYGKVAVTQSLITFIPERTPRKSTSHGASHPTATRYVPATWRGAQYLVSENEMTAFGDYVAGLGKFNAGLNPALWVDGSHFFQRTRDGEEELKEKGPGVPAPYERFIKKPIETSITAVGARRLKPNPFSVASPPSYESHTVVTINAGRSGGVRPGMSFRVRDSKAGDTVRILRVGRNSSVGEVVRSIDENKREFYVEWVGEEYYHRVPPAITPGWLLTTAPL